MLRRNFLKSAIGTGIGVGVGADGLATGVAGDERRPAGPPLRSAASHRGYMVDLLEKMASPVLGRMSAGRLRREFRPSVSPTWDNRDIDVAYLECFGRLMAGIAPWIEQVGDVPKDESRLRTELNDQALQSYVHSVDPRSPDLLLWSSEHQPLVDSAYYTNALLRAPKRLWEPLDATTRRRIVERIKGLRRVDPPYTNWLLFAAMNEAFLLSIGEAWDPIRLQLAIRKIEEWYVGDGWYSDGPSFHFDYYNSYVIQPMLVEILEVMLARNVGFDNHPTTEALDRAMRRMQRHGESLERMIGPDGAYPPIGRSLTYRTAAFQPLNLLALRRKLPASLSPGQVRSALDAAQRRIFAHPSNFDADGFLTIGFAGAQPALGDRYSNAGSMYLAALSLVALGLPATDTYWTAPSEPWTCRRAFAGGPFRKDYYVDY